jgi:hypothetical protein
VSRALHSCASGRGRQAGKVSRILARLERGEIQQTEPTNRANKTTLSRLGGWGPMIVSGRLKHSGRMVSLAGATLVLTQCMHIEEELPRSIDMVSLEGARACKLYRYRIRDIVRRARSGGSTAAMQFGLALWPPEEKEFEGRLIDLEIEPAMGPPHPDIDCRMMHNDIRQPEGFVGCAQDIPRLDGLWLYARFKSHLSEGYESKTATLMNYVVHDVMVCAQPEL